MIYWVLWQVYKVVQSLHAGCVCPTPSSLYSKNSFVVHIFLDQDTRSIYTLTQETIGMTAPSKPSQKARLQNDYGADYWVRNSQEKRVRFPKALLPCSILTEPHQHSTAGRGLFAGLQDVKHYNVDHGWARRKPGDSQTGLFGSLWSRYVDESSCGAVGMVY